MDTDEKQNASRKDRNGRKGIAIEEAANPQIFADWISRESASICAICE
jgi:hypothetical protein